MESVLQERLGIEAELSEECRHVAVVAAFVQKQVNDELAPAVADGLAVGIGPSFEVGSERVAGSPPVGVDLGPGQEVAGGEVGSNEKGTLP